MVDNEAEELVEDDTDGAVFEVIEVVFVVLVVEDVLTAAAFVVIEAVDKSVASAKDDGVEFVEDGKNETFELVVEDGWKEVVVKEAVVVVVVERVVVVLVVVVVKVVVVGGEEVVVVERGE